MKSLLSCRLPRPGVSRKGFTLVEVLVLIAVVAILASMLFPYQPRRTRPASVVCMSHLHQIGLGFLKFANDHANQFPPHLSRTMGGSMEAIGNGSPAPHFQTLSNYLLGNWHAWICPSDKLKCPATNYATFGDRNTSYFLSLDATPTHTNRPAYVILVGDRHLAVAGRPVAPGRFALTTNAAIGWTTELHRGGTESRGALLFVDGNVEFIDGRTLPARVERQGLATNWLAVP